MWLRDLLPVKLPYVRVMTFGYRAEVLGNTSVAGVRDNARRLLVLLKNKREGGSQRRPIIFLGHSLGGIIIKQVRRPSLSLRALRRPLRLVAGFLAR